MKARGSCPSVSAPMQTGDGLLTRLILHEPLTLEKLSGLCSAAAEHGNGIIEVTQRGSLQIRGLTETSASKFATELTRLQIGTDSGPPLITSPLLGLDASEPFDSTAVVLSLREAFRTSGAELNSLGAKVSVLVDGGGALHLDAVGADIRLVARNNALFQLSLGGTADDATHLGYVEPEQASTAVMAVLRRLVAKGPTARGRDLVDGGRSVRAPGPNTAQDPNAAWASSPSAAEVIGQHLLKGGTWALGFALPFGYTTASALSQVAKAAAAHGATAARPAPGRALLILGLSKDSADALREYVAAEGFIIDPQDLRRHVVTCAGAPACASAQLRTRELAPDIAPATASWVGTSKVIHLAGCIKGCAHPGPASLTIVGPDRVILNGSASDAPDSTLHGDNLVAEITRLCKQL